MCVDPVTLTAGAAVVSTGLSVAQAAGASSRQGSSQAAANKTYMENLARIGPTVNAQVAQNYNANQGAIIQERDAAAEQNFDIVRAMAEAKGTATAAAGEAGVGGVSFANILSDFEMREGLAKAKIDKNYQAKVGQTIDANESAFKRGEKAMADAVAGLQSPTIPDIATPAWGKVGSSILDSGLKIADLWD